LVEIAVLSLSSSLAYDLDGLHFSRGVPARRNQKRPGIWLIDGALRRPRSAGKASALFSVGPMEQEIQKKVATKNAKRQK
jgi:hypothetical protein